MAAAITRSGKIPEYSPRIRSNLKPALEAGFFCPNISFKSIGYARLIEYPLTIAGAMNIDDFDADADDLRQ